MPEAANNTILLSPLGILLAVVFALLMASLMFWMFSVPAPIAQQVAHARRSVSGIRKILVPTQGFVHDERAVELACRLGQEQKSQIVLAYVMEIPLTLSLNTPLPEEEQKAGEAMKRSGEIVKLHNLVAVERIERDRDAGKGILRTAKDLDVDLVVSGEYDDSADANIGQTLKSLYGFAGVRVNHVDHVKRTDHGKLRCYVCNLATRSDASSGTIAHRSEVNADRSGRERLDAAVRVEAASERQSTGT